ncbi:MAG: hypothetical protein ACRDV2_02935, partial [Actinomycetes bacterium]
VGLYTTFGSTTIDTADPEQLQLKALLPQAVEITSSPRNDLVGGFRADAIEGRLVDPASDAELRFVTYVVQVQEPETSGSSVVLTFFSAPGEFEGNRELFDRIVDTVRF